MTPLRASFYTLGCRLNQAETASISATFAAQGYTIVDFGEETDVCVINTCSVTEGAESKCRQAVRSVLRRSPHAYVTVTGCYAQVGVEALKRIEGLDLIVGTEDKMRVVDLIDRPEKQDEPRVVHSSKISREAFTIDIVGDYSGQTRANLKIQDGCNFACAFCIIPFTRGGARSRPVHDIVREARGLVAHGHREIVLTGVNIGTYHHDGDTLLEVVQALELVEGLDRIRISSIEPTTISDQLIDWMASSAKLCSYLHVPIQSGDDRVLRDMKRKYTSTEFAVFIERVAARIPDIGLGTDVMVGFPGEDDAAFTRTRSLLADLPLAYFHVFSYSERPHTYARRYTDHVPPQVVQQRSRELRELSERKKAAFYREFADRSLRVLFERREKSGYYTGFTDNYIKVGVSTQAQIDNALLPVRICGMDNGLALGTLIADGG
ncbi:tRNA (N(6)-L-threonylcarbamoyladenosine(37)-C(2))-methylthiotransferase MtaB [Candidatus Entotheonella palauensis]|uniref:tRNA (N(6)-L-threonylcarbamoyladenosine(37)-C(2))- methylthiotransferase MtaB n=1 Tax=Candidatus Entotheonella palauensis TaxID=93172 RepID=UPI000B7E3740|nr:tRNA (N(6)-L-threonylcarbamoyladenosine(37)-C(2))-methylthiotransferase MtaB [Candidatus Entotheonella palauensis]